MIHRYTGSLAVMAALLFAGSADSAIAQDYSLDPAFGATSLSAGFSPDPHTVGLTAGGEIDVGAVVAGCAGFVANPPDYRLNYSAGSFALYLSAMSDDDVTLVVNGPDRRWYCDDDSAGNLNPGVIFSNPLSGQYDIWVGTYGGGYPPATLRISEIGY